MGIFSSMASIWKGTGRAADVAEVLERYFGLTLKSRSGLRELVVKATIGSEGTNRNEFDIAITVLHVYAAQLDHQDTEVRKILAYWIGAGETLLARGFFRDPNTALGGISLIRDMIEFHG